jgi:hypothetical protein
MESTDQSHPGLDPDRIIPLLVRLRGKGISWLRGGYGESSGDRTVEDINFVDWDWSVHQCMPVKFHFWRRCRCGPRRQPTAVRFRYTAVLCVPTRASPPLNARRNSLVDLGPAVRGRMLGRRLVVVDVYLSPASLGSLHGLLTLCHCRVLNV